MEEEAKAAVDALAFPLLAQGHIIPFMRLCELLSSKNLNVVFLTSPLNANRLRTENNDYSSSGVRVMDIPLPAAPGLPVGAENTDKLTPAQVKILFSAIEQMEPSFTQLVARLRPKCLIADFHPLFLPAMAHELKIPVFYYATMGAYSLSIMHALTRSLPLPAGQPAAALPGLPKPVSLEDSDLLPPYRGAGRTAFPHGFLSTVFERLSRCGGLVMNTFDEMEAVYVDHVRTAFGVPVWSVGPVLNRPSGGSERGDVEKWLDLRADGSVVYVNFGSEIALSVEQIREVATGLEASGRCFVWALKKPTGLALGDARDVDEGGLDVLLPPGFRERTADRGLVLFSWAPQQAILSHSSTGGFLSHCGWNSTLESMINGVPMLAWPFQHDQPFVKKLLVEELGVAKEVERETVGDGVFVVKSAEVERAVKLIIEEGKGRDMRKRARELKAAAMRAVEEGGSSFTNLQNFISLIQHIPSE